MNISKLTRLNDNPAKHWGHNGYVTSEIYDVTTTFNKDFLSFNLERVDKEYKKTWDISLVDINNYNKIIEEGHSFGAFEENKLIGMIICEFKAWNNSLYIENILVSENYRGKGIGQKLINATINQSKINDFRLIELETQNTNVPAIKFYLKQGFNITGLNLKLYNDSEEKEVALFMTHNIHNRT